MPLSLYTAISQKPLDQGIELLGWQCNLLANTGTNQHACQCILLSLRRWTSNVSLLHSLPGFGELTLATSLLQPGRRTLETEEGGEKVCGNSGNSGNSSNSSSGLEFVHSCCHWMNWYLGVLLVQLATQLSCTHGHHWTSFNYKQHIDSWTTVKLM